MVITVRHRHPRGATVQSQGRTDRHGAERRGVYGDASRLEQFLELLYLWTKMSRKSVRQRKPAKRLIEEESELDEGPSL